jgi:hypothetical protein
MYVLISSFGAYMVHLGLCKFVQVFACFILEHVGQAKKYLTNAKQLHPCNRTLNSRNPGFCLRPCLDLGLYEGFFKASFDEGP